MRVPTGASIVIATRFLPVLVTGGLLALAAPASAAAQDSAFLERFEGKWTGSGTVRRSTEDSPHNARCTMTGVQEGLRLSLSGTCRVLAVFTRKVGADIQLDPATGVYSGVYSGSIIGPARISGKQRGNAISLTVTWPKPVNGDTRAAMRIENAGGGQFRITVTDAPSGGGQAVETTDVTLLKQG